MAEEPLDLHEEHLGKPCDLCGESCEANQELCVRQRCVRAAAASHMPQATDTRPCAARSNLLSCSFPACQVLSLCYHQDCLERYLKSIRCERCAAPLPAVPCSAHAAAWRARG